MTKLVVETMKECKGHLSMTNGIAELAEGSGHGFEAAVVVGDVHGDLVKLVKLRAFHLHSCQALGHGFIGEAVVS